MTFADQLLPWVGILRRFFFHVKNKLYSKPKEHSPAEASHLLKYIASVKIHSQLEGVFYSSESSNVNSFNCVCDHQLTP